MEMKLTRVKKRKMFCFIMVVNVINRDLRTRIHSDTNGVHA